MSPQLSEIDSYVEEDMPETSIGRKIEVCLHVLATTDFSLTKRGRCRGRILRSGVGKITDQVVLYLKEYLFH